MQPLDWNDLRYLLAVARGRTLAAAARRLQVDDTTVGRRLAAMQQALGQRLCQRLAGGMLELTPMGERVALLAERIEAETAALVAAPAAAAGAASGTVRLTSVPILVNHLLVPAVASLRQRHPALQLELIAEARDLSLTRREADLALRLARPKTGGTRVIARRIGMLRYEMYAAAAYPGRAAARLPWITYDEAMGHLPQARWIAAAVAREGGAAAPLRVNDADAAFAAVRAGLGRSLLPAVVADGDPNLRRLAPRRRSPVLSRELWLLSHAELRRLPRIEAVVEWLGEVVPR